MALAFRPLLSDSSMKSKYGSQALLVGQRPGSGTGAESGDTVGRFWPSSASAPVDRSGGHLIGRFCRCPPSPAAGSSNGDSGGLEVSSRRLPPNACFLLDAPQRPAQPPQRDDLLSLLFAQDIAHVDGG